jgi:Zn-finger nucleic acid-binding protein
MMVPSKCPPCPYCGVELKPAMNQGVLIGWRCEPCMRAIAVERGEFEQAQGPAPGTRGARQ